MLALTSHHRRIKLQERLAECLNSVVPNLQPRVFFCFQMNPPLFGPNTEQTDSVKAQKVSPTCSYEVATVNSRALNTDGGEALPSAQKHNYASHFQLG